MKKYAFGFCTLGLALSAGLLGPVPATASTTLTVNLVGGFMGLGETRKEALTSCYSEDFRQGSKIRVSNENGNVVGLGTLKWKTVGKVVDQHLEDPEFYDADDSIRFEVDCILTTKMSLGGGKFFDVTIDGEEAGTYSYGELKKDKWKLNLSWG